MKVKDVIQVLSEHYSLEDDICVSWWSKDLFEETAREAGLSQEQIDENWGYAVEDFGQNGGYDHINEQMFDILFGLIADTEWA
jgi:hypothetical protein